MFIIINYQLFSSLLSAPFLHGSHEVLNLKIFFSRRSLGIVFDDSSWRKISFALFHAILHGTYKLSLLINTILERMISFKLYELSKVKYSNVLGGLNTAFLLCISWWNALLYFYPKFNLRSMATAWSSKDMLL